MANVLSDITRPFGLDPSQGYDTAAAAARDAQAQARQLSDLQWQRQMAGLQQAQGYTGQLQALYNSIYSPGGGQPAAGGMSMGAPAPGGAPGGASMTLPPAPPPTAPAGGNGNLLSGIMHLPGPALATWATKNAARAGEAIPKLAAQGASDAWSALKGLF